jgi:hypothetical protein
MRRFNLAIAFVLGVGVGLGMARFVDDDDDARPEVQARAAPPVVMPSAIAVAPIEQVAQAAPAPKPHFAGSAASVDTTLSEAVDAGRAELVPAEPPKELATEIRPFEAAPAGSVLSAQGESAQEIEIRSETEKAIPQAGTSTDGSLLPHERL